MISPEAEQQENTDFLSSGGKIIERTVDGEVKRWKCGKDDSGEPVDPPGIDGKDVLRRLDENGEWQGMIPDSNDLEEIKKWRSDWNNPVPPTHR